MSSSSLKQKKPVPAFTEEEDEESSSSSSSSSDAPRCVVAIDIGFENMGFGSKWSNNPDPYLEHTPLRITYDGDYYREYKEGIVCELVQKWLYGHWDIISKASLVLVEKTMSKQGEIQARACNNIETSICSTLMSKPDAPPFLVIAPVAWKNANGIQTQGSHHQNKAESIKHFKQAIGAEKFAALSRIHAKLDDIADVYHMLRFGEREYDRLYKEALANRNHTENIFENREGKPRIYYSERVRGYLDFTKATEDLARLRAEKKFVDPLTRHRILVSKRMAEQANKTTKQQSKRPAKMLKVGLEEVTMENPPPGREWVGLEDLKDLP